MKRDAFSSFHPIVSFVFFLVSICFTAVFYHPAYLLAGLISSGAYYLMLSGKKGLRSLLYLIPLFFILTLVNPLLNTQGEKILFFVFSRPYTLEALAFGAVTALTLVSMLLWFGCYGKVMSGDKFTSLFGNLLPSLSLLIVMIFRMIPNLLRKKREILDARRALGKGSACQRTLKAKLTQGFSVLSALTSWALEASAVTADSMKSRGYGCGKRSSFNIYKIGRSDILLIILMLSASISVIITAAAGGAGAEFTPSFSIAPLSGQGLFGFIAYCIFLFIPIALQLKESLKWRILKSKA